MNHRRIYTAVVAMALVLAACGGGTTSPSASGAEPSASGGGQTGGTLVFGGARLSSSLDPALTSDGESFRVLRQVYETLVDLAPGSTNELVGGLAETWEGEPDGTVYTFHLREGVTFQDGTPFNAEAVKVNFDRMQNFVEELQASAYYYGQVINGFGPDNLIKSVEATDELTVTFTLSQPQPTFLYGLALPCFGIVSPAVLESTNADDPAGTFGTEVTQAGTGPFIARLATPRTRKRPWSATRTTGVRRPCSTG